MENLFYDPLIEPTDKEFELNEGESKHASRVLRMHEGEELFLLDGRGGLYQTKILSVGKKCRLQILESTFVERPKQEIHIAVAPTKLMERMEWFVEKATEIGVTEISWLMCQNSERKVIKNERIEKILVSAMKQSKRRFLPKVNELMKLNEFLEKHPKGAVAHCFEDRERKTIREVYETTNFPILIGPEGDFSREELDKIKKFDYAGITLGETRLRTETAALVACMQCVYL